MRKNAGFSNILTTIGLAILILVIPLSVKLIETRQDIRNQAAYPPPNCMEDCMRGGVSIDECYTPCGLTNPNATISPQENYQACVKEKMISELECRNAYLRTTAPTTRPNLPEGCCSSSSDCPGGQACNIPNGACGGGGTSCNPLGYAYHKGCQDNMCVNVAGAGSDECSSNSQCGSQKTACEKSNYTDPGCCKPSSCCGLGLGCNSSGTACNVTGTAASSCSQSKTGWKCSPGFCCGEGLACTGDGKSCSVTNTGCTSKNITQKDVCLANCQTLNLPDLVCYTYCGIQIASPTPIPTLTPAQLECIRGAQVQGISYDKALGDCSKLQPSPTITPDQQKCIALQLSHGSSVDSAYSYCGLSVSSPSPASSPLVTNLSLAQYYAMYSNQPWWATLLAKFLTGGTGFDTLLNYLNSFFSQKSGQQVISNACTECIKTASNPTDCADVCAGRSVPTATPITQTNVNTLPGSAGTGQYLGGINIDQSSPDGMPTVAELKDLGIGWVRMVYFADVHNTNKVDQEKIAQNYLDNGIKVLWVLNQDSVAKPIPQTDGIYNPAETSYASNFAQTASSLAKQFNNSNVAFEIWNEPNQQGNNSGIYVTPQNLGKFTQAVNEAIKSQNNSSSVLVGSILGDDPGYVDQMIAATTDKKLPGDAVSVHPYTPGDINYIAQTINDFSKYQGPIWITEVGWEPDPKTQANFIKQVYDLTLNNSNVATTMWYTWSDSTNPGFGIVDSNGNPKLSYSTLQKETSTLTQVAQGQSSSNTQTSTTPPTSSTSSSSGCSLTNLGGCITSLLNFLGGSTATVQTTTPSSSPTATQASSTSGGNAGGTSGGSGGSSGGGGGTSGFGTITEPTSTPNSTVNNNAQSLQKKVLIINFNPTIQSKGNQKLSLALGWNDPNTLANTYINDVSEVSYNLLKYQIVQTLDINDFPTKSDGFKYSAQTYLDCVNDNTKCHSSDTADYQKIISEYGVCDKLNSGQIDELWLFGGPYFGYYEAVMAGPGAFNTNGPPVTGTTCQRKLQIMGFNYERGNSEMLEDLGHRAEGTMANVFDGWNQASGNTTWDKYTWINKNHPGSAQCGSVHFAPNSTSDYDWSNQTTVTSACEDWLQFPNLTGATQSFNCSRWNCDGYQYKKWWLKHLPHSGGTTDGKYNNWWQYIAG